MSSQDKSWARVARILSVFDVLATAGPILIFAVPVYATSVGGASVTGGSVTVTRSYGSETLFAANPEALAVVTAIAIPTLVALALAMITAWLGWSHARSALAVVLAPLTGLAILAVFSIGIFMAPLVVLGWGVFSLSGQPSMRTVSRGDA